MHIPKKDLQYGYLSPWNDSPQLTHACRMINTPLQVLGARIRARRKELAWTQEDLAANAGLDRSYVGGIERGERNITFTVLCDLSKSLGWDVAKLTCGLPGDSK